MTSIISEGNAGIHCFVSGRVQGVWFRAGTQEKARELGLTGWVCNLPDGRVEVWAFGKKELLQELQIWLKQGPELAKVSDVLSEEVGFQSHTRFAIK